MNRTVWLTIDYSLCQSCPRCKASQACRLKAIVQLDPGEDPYLDVERCRDCRVCLPACPHGAVKQLQK